MENEERRKDIKHWQTKEYTRYTFKIVILREQ